MAFDFKSFGGSQPTPTTGTGSFKFDSFGVDAPPEIPKEKATLTTWFPSSQPLQESPLSAGLKTAGNYFPSVVKAVPETLKFVGNVISKPYDVAKKTYEDPMGQIKAAYESADSFGKAVLNAIYHPLKTVNTVGNAFKPVAGAAQIAETALYDLFTGNETPMTGELIDAYDKYAEGLTKLAIEDPFLVGSMVYGGVEGGAALAGKSKVLSGLTSKAAQIITKPVENAVGGITRFGGETAKFGVSQATGLSKDTISQVLKTPEAFTAEARAATSDVELGELVKNAITKRADDLSELGSGYDMIRATPGVVNVNPSWMKQVLRDQFGFKTSTGMNGQTLIRSTTNSATRNPADIRAVQNFLNTWSNRSGLTAKEFLNMRNDLSELARFDKVVATGKTVQSERVAKALRFEANKLIRDKFTGLKDLDNLYTPEREVISKIKKEYLNSEGNLRDGALSKIANSINKRRDPVLQRLREFVPDIEQRVRVLRAIEDFESAKNIRAGAYIRAGIGGAALLTGNIPVIMAALITQPAAAMKILMAAGFTAKSIRPVLDGVRIMLNNINNFRIPPQIAKEVQEWLKNPKMGLSLENVGDNLTPLGKINKATTKKELYDIAQMESELIPLSKIDIADPEIKAAIKDFRKGQKTMSNLPMFAEKQPNGTYVIRDGKHRLVQQASEGKTDFWVITDKDLYRRLAEREDELTRYIKKPDGKLAGSKPAPKPIEAALPPEVATALREAKGLSADDIMKKNPDINLKRDVPVTDVYGKKSVIPEGEALTPYELKGNKVLLQDGETYIVTKNQYQNIKNNAVTPEAKPFAPELAGTEESVKGNLELVTKKEGDSITMSSGQETVRITPKDDFYLIQDSNGRTIGSSQDTLNQAKAAAENYFAKKYDRGATRYSQYTLPGGKNYKEILVKAPLNKLDIDTAKLPEGYTVSLEKLGIGDRWNVRTPEGVNHTYPADIDTKEKAIKEFMAGFYKPVKEMDTAFESSHWDEPNVLFHNRMNERTYKGKKVSFLEEIQSDWAKAVREGKSKMSNPDMTVTRINDELQRRAHGTQRDFPDMTTQQLYDARNAAESQGGVYKASTIPEHPLLKQWTPLAVKRALKEAVDSGADYFAWITGEQTSARYNLATYVKDVHWNRSLSFEPKDWYKNIAIKAKQGKDVGLSIAKDGKILESVTEPSWKGKKLDEVLGKGLADKIMEKESGTLSGEGLKFGGEWAENLYDRQVPNIVKDLTGAKVETLDMGLPTGAKDSFVYDIRGDVIRPEDIKEGMRIKQANDREIYVVSNVKENGKFSAINEEDMVRALSDINAKVTPPKGSYVDVYDIEAFRERLPLRFVHAEKSFDIGAQPKQFQQAIRLTPEVKARIRGEAPPIKPASGREPLSTNVKNK